MSPSQSPVKPVFAPSDRAQNLPPYTLAKVFQDRDAKLQQGVDVIDLGVGNPDVRPPERAVQALKDALDDPVIQNHRYSTYDGLPEFREAIASWYANRFGVSVAPHGETLPLVGSKEGIAKFILAYANPGDTILMQTPCYPAYLSQGHLAQLEIVEVPLVESLGWRFDLGAIPDDVADRAKILCMNFPSNPTGGVETREFYEEVFAWARKHDVIVLSDIAYCDLPLDPSYRGMSFLEIDKNKERTVEFHSFSKSYSMQGWRVGMCAGNREMVQTLLKVKSVMDFSIFLAVQRAAAAVLTGPQDYGPEVSAMYQKRLDVFMSGIKELGYDVKRPRAGMYVWMPIPRRFDNSLDVTAAMLNEAGVLVAPGSGFGKAGEGYVRVALCVPEARLHEAVDRMREAGFTY